MGIKQMQMHVEGIVIRETKALENDKYITILTKEDGVIEAYAKGAKKSSSKLAIATNMFCYSSFELFKNKSKYYVDQADVINIFYDIKNDIERLSLASYFCQVAEEIGASAENSGELLRLLLNCMHLLSNTKKDIRIVKSVFELRALSICGFCPDVVACKKCGAFEGKMRFYILEGILTCEKCAADTDNSLGFAVLTGAVLSAIRHIVYSEAEKAFSFTLDEDNLILLGQITETYLLCQTERNYKSLEFYKNMK